MIDKAGHKLSKGKKFHKPSIFRLRTSNSVRSKFTIIKNSGQNTPVDFRSTMVSSPRVMASRGRNVASRQRIRPKLQ